MDHHIAMLRITGTNGEQAAAACVDGTPGGPLGVGEEDGWLSGCKEVPSVVFDCTQVVQLSDPKDVSAMAAWLSAAAVWLRIQILEKEAT